jgi:hypothetical protein
MGARGWAARARYDFACMLLTRDASGDRERAEQLAGAVISVARELGMRLLERQTIALFGSPVPEPKTAPARTESPAVFRRDGDYYSVSFEGDTFRLRDSKGLRYLAILLGSPGREHHSMELVAAVEKPAAGPGPYVEETSPAGSTEEILDAEARAKYKARLADLEDDIQEADEMGDSERASRARSEQEFIARELASAMGLGGRARHVATDAERARINVTRAIRSALSRIAENSRTLGDHLEATISTGTFCSYTPDPRAVPAWKVT